MLIYCTPILRLIPKDNHHKTKIFPSRRNRTYPRAGEIEIQVVTGGTKQDVVCHGQR